MIGLIAARNAVGSAITPNVDARAVTLLFVAAHGIFAFLTACLILTDHRAHRLPNGLVGAATACAIALLTPAVGAVYGSVHGLHVWGTAVAAALLLLGLRVAVGGGLGAGDVKLTPAAVVFAVWPDPLTGAAVSAAVLALLSALLAVTLRVRGTRRAPFGPALLFAAWITLIILIVTVIPHG